MRAYIFAAGLVALGVTQTASAQAPFIYKPIDTNKALVQPTDAASGLVAGATTSTFRTITRTVAGAIENNGFVRTINNLLGRRAKAEMPQAGFSPLPQPGTYISTGYGSAIGPQMPVGVNYGQSSIVTQPVAPSARR